MEHDQLELSASEWKSAGAGDSLVDKQHNKNLRVNACVLLRILRLPFDEFNNDIRILSMEWTGSEGKIISMKRYNDYFVATTIGDINSVTDHYQCQEVVVWLLSLTTKRKNRNSKKPLSAILIFITRQVISPHLPTGNSCHAKLKSKMRQTLVKIL
ncbi:hypothetical protein BDC45DRAFT_530381 [Circinella umbellata]|nr:hypothetical protein BDC45DRAFT_530381 [Circinella umbellata]